MNHVKFCLCFDVAHFCNQRPFDGCQRDDNFGRRGSVAGSVPATRCRCNLRRFGHGCGRKKRVGFQTFAKFTTFADHDAAGRRVSGGWYGNQVLHSVEFAAEDQRGVLGGRRLSHFKTNGDSFCKR